MTLDSVPASARRHPRAVAIAMSKDWTPILQQTPPQERNIRKWFEAIERPSHNCCMNALTAERTAEDVGKAIARLHRGKSTGPDRIPNNWYKDFQEDITPVLVRVYNEALSTGSIPASFTYQPSTAFPKAQNRQQG